MSEMSSWMREHAARMEGFAVLVEKMADDPHGRIILVDCIEQLRLSCIAKKSSLKTFTQIVDSMIAEYEEKITDLSATNPPTDCWADAKTADLQESPIVGVNDATKGDLDAAIKIHCTSDLKRAAALRESQIDERQQEECQRPAEVTTNG